MNPFGQAFSNYLRRVEAAIKQTQPKLGPELLEAGSYTLNIPGKRVRPVLVLGVSDLLKLDATTADTIACSVEYIHNSTLIHDDLPALDNDTLRRGKPTCHVVYGEGAALLAGDSLVSEAFRLIAGCAEISAENKVRLMDELASTYSRVCEGQMLDLGASEESLKKCTVDEALNKLEYRHLKKTGALLRYCAIAPAIAAGVAESSQRYETLAKYGEQLGLLFQITDDILDVTSTVEKMGKHAHRDELLKKVSAASLLGLDGAMNLKGKIASNCFQLLNNLPESKFLIGFTEMVMKRER